MTDTARPDAAAWRALVERSLKGADFDERLVWRTPDGLAVQPLYPPAAQPNVPALSAADPSRPWDVRTRTRHPDPARANRDALADLEGGAASIVLSLGPEGVGVNGADALARALDGVLLELAPVALEAGFLGAQAAEWLSEVAKASPTALLGFELDPMSAFASGGAAPSALAAILSDFAQTAVRLAEAHPLSRLFLASGRIVHEAGGTEAQEVAFAAAAALAYLRALDAAGLPPDATAARIDLGLSADGDVLLSLAKLRAARAVWARLAGALGSHAPARLVVRSSRRMLARLDPWTNMLRLTAAGFAAAAAGADVIELDPFTEPLGLPTAFARRQARNTQLVLMEEAHLGRVRDPAAGAGAVEALTDAVARQAWTLLQRIEAEGGVVAALESGLIAREVGDARAARQAAYVERRATLVGVTAFTNPDAPPVEVETPGETSALTAAPPQWPGAPSRCPPLRPIRWAEPFETAALEPAGGRA